MHGNSSNWQNTVGMLKILHEVPASTEWEYWSLSLDCGGCIIWCGHTQFGLQKDKQRRYIYSYYENDSCRFCLPPYLCLKFQHRHAWGCRICFWHVMTWCDTRLRTHFKRGWKCVSLPHVSTESGDLMNFHVAARLKLCCCDSLWQTVTKLWQYPINCLCCSYFPAHSINW